MNKWIGTVRLGKDVDYRQTSEGKVIVSFTGACNRRFKNANGEYVTDWFDFVAFGSTAEFINKYCHKGSKILVECEAHNNNYEKDGVKHYGTQFVVNQVEFAESKNADSSPQTNPDEGFMSMPEGAEDELPFN